MDDEFDQIASGPGTKPPPAPVPPPSTDDFDAIATAPPAVAHIQGRGRTVEPAPRMEEPSSPMFDDPSSTTKQIVRGVAGMVTPFLSDGKVSPVRALVTGAAKTGLSIAKQTLGSVNDAVVAPGKGRFVDTREVYPFTGEGPEYSNDLGGVSGSQRAAGAAQLGALAVAGPVSEAVEGAAVPFLGRVAGKVAGGAVGAAPIGVAYDPAHPVAGAATMAIVGGALAPLHAAQHDVPVVTRPPDVREAVEGAQVHGAPDPDPVAAPVVEPPTSATPTGVTSQAAENARLVQERDEARRAAETSPTTGQPNKLALQRALPAAEADPNTAVVRADINGMKNVNDAPGLGHDYADQYVLKRAASAMKAAADEVGVPDRSFHPDGDQFVALVPKEQAEAYRDALERNYGVVDHGNGIRSSISAGIGDTSPEADAEMYQRKAQAKAMHGIPDRAPPPDALAGSPYVANFPTADIHVDPDRFQFKMGANDESGITRSLKGDYNPEYMGELNVWKDPADGKTYMVNGHHRLERASRAGAETVPLVKYMDAPNAETARAGGALLNIADGNGTPLDVAKFFKDAGGMTEENLAKTGLDPSGALVTKGLALGKLSDDLFRRVYKGEIPEDVAVGIGKVLDQPEQQRAAVALIEKSGRDLTPGEISSVARQVRDAGSLTIENEDMFGTHDTAISLAVERARLAESFRKDFSKETSLFGFVSKEGRAEALAKAGNTIDVEGSKARAMAGAQAQEMFDRLSTRSGPIADILTEGAKRLAAGERIAAIKSDLDPHLRAAIAADVSRGLGEGGEGGDRGVQVGGVEAPHEEGTDASTATGSSAPDDGRVADSHDETQAPLFSKNLFGEEGPDEPSQGGLFGEREGTIDMRSTAQAEASLRAEMPQLEYRMTHSVSEVDRTAAARRLAEIQRVLNRNEKIGADEIKTRIRGGGDTLFGSVAMDSRPVRSEAVANRAPLDSAIPELNHKGDVANPQHYAEDPFEHGRELDTLRNGNRLVDSFNRLFRTASRSRAAELVGQIVREFSGQAALNDARVREALKGAARDLGRLSDEDRLQFIDDVENDRPTTRPELQGYADVMRKLLDDSREEVKALGTGKLAKFYRNYFPHIWADPVAAERQIGGIMSKRSLEGPKSFLKKRSIVTMKDGIEAGLTPLTTNPVDLVMLKIHEMNRYVMGQRILAEVKVRGLAKFVDAHSVRPDGWSKLDDKLGIVYGDPTTTFTEAFDKLAREKTEDLIDELGFKHDRTLRMPGSGTLGYYEPGKAHIVTRGATPLDVLYHEFGHGLDEKYGLWNYIREPFDAKGAPKGPRGGTPKDTPERIAQRKVIDEELRQLADQRWAGEAEEDVSGFFKDYVRNRYEKMAVMVQAYVHAPELMQEFAPTVKARFDRFLDEHPDVAPLREVKPSLVYGSQQYVKKVKGMVIDGHIYVPDGVATVMNNFLSPGLTGHPLYDAYRGVGNVLTSAQLGLSAFHMGFTAMDATISKASLGLEQLATKGQRLRGLGSLAQSVVPGVAPIANIVRGDRLMTAALVEKANDPLSEIVRGVVMAGGRVKMEDMYRTGAAAKFWKVLEDAQTLQRTPTMKGVVTAPLLPVRLLGHSLARVLEVASYPIMEYAVPRMKLGVFSDLYAHELRKLGPDAKLDDVREAAQKVWDSVDNRLGQMVYDNLFWHRATKDMTMASVRSVGWNLGTLREIGGGAADLASAPARLFRGDQVVTHRMAYLVALPAIVALYGSIYQYLRTGSGPTSMKDAFYPRTGNVNPDGTDERVQLPSYMKDIHAYTTDPLKTLKDKANPAITTVADMLANRDWQNNEVRNPDDPAVIQFQQEADFIVNQFTPFGVQNARQSKERGAPLGDQAQAFVGVTPAPRDVVRAPWQQKMAEFTGALTPGGLTPEAVEQRNQRRKLTSDLRSQKPGALDSLRAEMQRGDVNPKTAIDLLKSGLTSTSAAESFKRLTAEQAVVVFKLMPPAVQDQFRGRLMVKISNARKSGRAVEVPAGAVR